jgi:hypothetical protein
MWAEEVIEEAALQDCVLKAPGSNLSSNDLYAHINNRFPQPFETNNLN